MNLIVRSIALSAVALVLCSCPETQVPKNFGAQPLKLKAADWEGFWSEPGDKDGMEFVITNAAQGEFTAKEKKEQIRAVVREISKGEEGKDLAFLIHFDKDATEFGSFNLIRRPEKGAFCLWNLNHEVVEAAVKSGELKGELKPVKKTDKEDAHNHVRLAADPTNYTKLLGAKYWDWTQPGFFVRTRK